MRKLIIIGSGPAGLTAAIYAARAELKPLVLAGEKSGGQLMNTSQVENWPGAEQGVMGPELMTQMRKQAQRFGAEIVDRNVIKVDFSVKPFRVWVKDEEYEAESVIVASGAESKMLGTPGEKEMVGRGVSTCAVCDAPFFKDKIVYVIGGGDAAVEDALALTKHAKQVFLVHRRDELRASKIMVKRVKENNKIEIMWSTQLSQIKGKDRVEEVVVEGKGGKQTLKADGVFLAIGHQPATVIFKQQLELDEKGYIKTKMMAGDSDEWLKGYPTMSSIEGVFAAGDVVDSRYKQAVTAAGMGCQAALDAEKWLDNK